MPVYTTNIPQATDNPSVSQGQLLQNFQTLNNLYGTNGDHYAWDDTTSAEVGRHAKVTMPGLPTANAPGNIIPTSATGNAVIFSQTINNQTTPFVTRDNLTPTAPYGNIWPLLPIKAFATFTAVITGPGFELQTLNQFFNITSISHTGNVFTVTMPIAMRTTNYGVLALSSTAPGGIGGYNITSTTTFTFIGTINNASQNTIVVLEP